MSGSFDTPFAPPPASAIERRVEQRRRQVELIHILRRLALLAQEEAWDTGAVAERSRLARLVVATDDLLRKLVNEKAP